MVEGNKDKRTKRFARTFSADETGSNLGKRVMNGLEGRGIGVGVSLVEVGRGQENDVPVGTEMVMRYVDRSMAEIKEVEVGHGGKFEPQIDEHDMVL